MKSWPPALVILFLTGLIASGHLSTNIYAPSLPSMVAFFATDMASVQATISIYMLFFAVGQLVVGPLSDRFGRRPVLIGGLVVFVATTVAIFILPSVSRSIDLVIVGRALQALGACAGPIVARAIIRDLYTREETAKVMAYIALAMGLAPAFAPVLGGYLEVWFDWRASFAVVAVFAAIMLVATVAAMPETNQHRALNAAERPITMVTNFWRLLRSREYLRYIGAGSFVFAAMFAFMAAAPFVVIETLGYSPAAYGWYSISGIAGYMSGSWVTSRIADRVGVDRMVPIGVMVVTLGTSVYLALSLAAPLGVWTLFGPFVSMTFGMAILFPSTLAGAVSVIPEIAGTASALYGFVQMLAASVAIALIGVFGEGHIAMAWVVSLTIFAAFAVVLLDRPGAKASRAPAVSPGE